MFLLIPMSQSEKIWKFTEANKKEVAALTEKLSVPAALSEYILNREITIEEAENYLEPKLSNMGDPFELPDMEKAVARIKTAIEKGECILIHGDYDVDGISSTTLMMLVLKALGAARVEHFIPLRLDDGYGLSIETVDQCKEKCDPGLIITVDCGTGSVEAVKHAGSLGIDVIITDHHEASAGVAEALAVINPKVSEQSTALDMLAGVGVAFKLCHALVKTGKEQGDEKSQNMDLRDYLYLVAMGTVADMVPLKGENRLLAFQGLKRMNQHRDIGFNALCEVSGIKDKISSHHIGFALGPRINAAGRLENPAIALEMLLMDNYQEAWELAKHLDETNLARREVETAMVDDAIAQIKDCFDPAEDFAIVIAGEGWHPGVVGIVASRLVQRYYRPSIVIGIDKEGKCKGSCRSIDGLDLVASLQECAAHLTKYGGHKMAAGLELDKENLDSFKAEFNAIAKLKLSNKELKPSLKIDACIKLSEANEELIQWIAKCEPFGLGNPRPIWYAKNVRRIGKPRLLKDAHLKLKVTDDTAVLDAISFNWGNQREWPERPVDVAFQLSLNEFRGLTTLQMQVLDIREM